MSIGPALTLLEDYWEVADGSDDYRRGADLVPAMLEILDLLREHVRLRFDSRRDLAGLVAELEEHCLRFSKQMTCPKVPPGSSLPLALGILERLRSEMDMERPAVGTGWGSTGVPASRLCLSQ